MSSIAAPDESSSLSSANLVELVPFSHGAKKVKYAGRTFKLHSTHGTRYYWRCDLRPPRRRPSYNWDPDWQDVRSVLSPCKSRLITDLFGDQHMVYDCQPHDEELHRLDERRKRRANASGKQQLQDEGPSHGAEGSKKRRLSKEIEKRPPRRWIRDFRYVLERRDGGLQTWRCEFSECPSRCRTHYDGLIVDEPSLHLEDVHAQMGRPFTNYQPCINERISRRLQEQRQHLRDDAEGQSSPSPSASAAANSIGDIAACSGGRKSHQVPAMLVQGTGTGAPPSDGATSSNTSSDSGGRNHPSLPYSADKSAVVVRGEDHSDMADRKHAHRDKAKSARNSASVHTDLDSKDVADKNPQLTLDSVTDPTGDADVEENVRCSPVLGDYEGSSVIDVDEMRPYKGAGSPLHDHDNEANSGLHARCEEVLQMTCSVGDSREWNLRASVLVHMHRLLEAETNLVKQKCRVEVIRGKVLHQQLEDLAPRKEPTPLGS